ncbi:hypothetical protein [Neobacillus citreus]|uniref:Uncharacterized protein n=1 Tax=Neobacillus citreus TaxID=2833578 RepID=A0A942T5A0_9BACI|nr:hypothetical protein [Neobacillus citreus]MCH6264917.1 hypothetical protein [Neobacillus citreus]
MEEPVQAKTFGSCTIKRNGSIVKGTRGNRIAKLGNPKSNKSTKEHKKEARDHA